MSRFAYADPPYYGSARKLYAKHHPEAAEFDTLDAHKSLIYRLQDEFPDGWALSMTSGNLIPLLPLCPSDVRIAAWVKPFAIFKPGVNPGYTWEPVVWRGGRAKRSRTEPTVRDFLSCNITLKKGLTGAKPEEFCEWILDLLGFLPGDELFDVFPGTGVMERVVSARTTHECPGCGEMHNTAPCIRAQVECDCCLAIAGAA